MLDASKTQLTQFLSQQTFIPDERIELETKSLHQMSVKVVIECLYSCLLKPLCSLCVNVDSGVLAALRLVQTATNTAWGICHHLLKVFTDLSIGECI